MPIYLGPNLKLPYPTFTTPTLPPPPPPLHLSLVLPTNLGKSCHQNISPTFFSELSQYFTVFWHFYPRNMNIITKLNILLHLNRNFLGAKMQLAPGFEPQTLRDLEQKSFVWFFIQFSEIGRFFSKWWLPTSGGH